MKTFIQEGHPVQIEGIGTFTPSFSAKSQLVEEEALKRMNFVFDKTDSTQDSVTQEEPNATEPKPENPDVV